MPWDLVKLIIVGLIVVGLGSTFAGNWIRCTFFDAAGCLPALAANLIATEIPFSEVEKLASEHEKIDEYPAQPQNFTYIKYDIKLSNTGRNHVDDISIRLIPTLEEIGPGRILLYGIQTGISETGVAKDSYTYVFNSLHFVDVSSLTTTEICRLFFVVAYDTATYRRATDPVALFVLRCDKCQQPLLKLQLENLR